MNTVPVLEGELAEKLDALLKGEHQVRFAYLFGSRALGLARADSDVDIAAFFSRDAETAEEVDVGERLSRQLGLEVQVINLNERPAASFFAKVLPSALVIKEAPERTRWEQEIGKMAGEEPGTLEDYLEFVLDSMTEKTAKLREAMPLLDEMDVDALNQGDIRVAQKFLGAFFMVFQPLEAITRRMANYVHLTQKLAVPTDLKPQITLLGKMVGMDEATVEPLRRFAGVRNKLAHAYWNLTDQELTNADVRAARQLLEDLTRQLDSFVQAARQQLAARAAGQT
ncbi:MAG: nucleotidyltransferase domain-containing protein [Chloroflexi bacterium]|nr:nucleotidyltransferase domain-containing protein [Chloroflexota bacterium]